MGCDIHAHLEVKVNGNWQYSATPLEDVRHYAWFEFLVGVRARHGWTPHHSPRGLPADVTPETQDKFNCWCGDAHTPSYITKQELLGVNPDLHLPYYNNKLTSLEDMFGQYLSNWNDAMSKFEDARIVFWFDC